MAVLIPFRALRPAPEAAARVAAVPYDVVTRDEASALADGNRLSFLHVSRAEIDLDPNTDPHADAVYAKAAANFAELRERAPLVMEDRPAIYVYRLRMGSHEQTGVAACFLVDEYDRNVIKKHERTRRDKEDDRTRHMLELGAQTGPVFLTYPADAAIDALTTRVTAGAPLFDFTAADGVQHTVWRAPDGDATRLCERFAGVPSVYIADGHHRAASASRACHELRASRGAGEWDSFLAVAFPDSQVQILPYNRVVRDLAGLTADQFLERLRQHVGVSCGGPIPAKRGDVSMFVAGVWYRLCLGAGPPDRSPADRLDVSRLQDTVLAPVLGIGDVRTDKRIDFVGGGRGPAALEALVGSGAFAVAFAMYPVGVGDLMQISDAGGIMPPKSTWFEPKLRDGLLSHVL